MIFSNSLRSELKQIGTKSTYEIRRNTARISYIKKPGSRYTFRKAYSSDCSSYKIPRVATQNLHRKRSSAIRNIYVFYILIHFRRLILVIFIYYHESFLGTKCDSAVLNFDTTITNLQWGSSAPCEHDIYKSERIKEANWDCHFNSACMSFLLSLRVHRDSSSTSPTSHICFFRKLSTIQ